MRAEGFGAADRDPGQLAAMARVPIEHDLLASDTDDIGEKASAGPQRRPNLVKQTRLPDAAANKDGVGMRQTGERARSLIRDDAQPRNTEPCRVTRDHRGAPLVALYCDRRAARNCTQPFDRDRTAAGPDIPQSFAGERGQALETYAACRALLAQELSAEPEPKVPEAGESRRIILKGEIPSPLAPPPGCRFHTRCPIAVPQCATHEPPWQELDERALADGRVARWIRAVKCEA